MYDLTRFSSVQHMEEWIQFVREENASIPILILGSKSDLKDRICVKNSDIEPYLKKYAFDHRRCSSKDGTGVEDILAIIADGTLKYMHERSKKSKPQA